MKSTTIICMESKTVALKKLSSIKDLESENLANKSGMGQIIEFIKSDRVLVDAIKGNVFDLGILRITIKK